MLKRHFNLPKCGKTCKCTRIEWNPKVLVNYYPQRRAEEDRDYVNFLSSILLSVVSVQVLMAY